MSLVVLLLMNTCTTARHAAPDLAERLERVRTIVLVPPKAGVLREFVGTETEVPEWPTDAERNLTVALTRHLEFEGRFAVRGAPG